VKAETCEATTRTGSRCAAQAVDGRHCPWHATSPEWVAKRSQWSAEGGRKRSNAERARKLLPDESLSVAQLHSYLGVVFRDVIAGKTEPGVATAAATVARTMAELAKASDLESRLRHLEWRLAGRSA